MSHFRDKIKDEVIDAPLFKEFNLDYMGPVDGHDIASLIKVLQATKEHDGPIVIHVLTQKGKGYNARTPPSAPSIPATAIIQLALRISSSLANKR